MRRRRLPDKYGGVSIATFKRGKVRLENDCKNDARPNGPEQRDEACHQGLARGSCVLKPEHLRRDLAR